MTVLSPWHLIALSVDYTNIMLTLEQKATTHPWKQSISFCTKYLEVCLYNAWKIVNLKKKMRKIRYQQWWIQGRGALLNFKTKLRPERSKKNWGGTYLRVWMTAPRRPLPQGLHAALTSKNQTTFLIPQHMIM